jgi:hypothetical protein
MKKGICKCGHDIHPNSMCSICSCTSSRPWGKKRRVREEPPDLRKAFELFRGQLLSALTIFEKTLTLSLEQVAAQVMIAEKKPGLSKTEFVSLNDIQHVLATSNGKPEKHAKESHDVSLGRCELRLLEALQSRPNTILSKTALSLLSGYRKKSSSFANGLSVLKTGGFIEGSSKTGYRALVPAYGKPKLAREFWQKRLGPCERAMLQELKVMHAGWSKDQLAEAIEYSVTSSSFSNALSVLRGLGLVETMPNGNVRLTELCRLEMSQ